MYASKHCSTDAITQANQCVQVRALLDSGVNVGLGVDGSASNDSGNLLHEARLACFLQRAAGDVSGELNALVVAACQPQRRLDVSNNKVAGIHSQSAEG